MAVNVTSPIILDETGRNIVSALESIGVSKIGDLTALKTLIKSSLVGAINENTDNLAPLIFNNAAAHNAIYRGKFLGTSVTAEQYEAIAAGTFDDLYIGDYWTINGVNYRIAAFDYWLHSSDTACETHHVVIVPDTNLLNADGSTTHWMHSADDTSKGYIGTDFYAGTNGNNGKATCLNLVNAAFGSSHILTHREHLTNASANGRPSAGAWYDSKLEIPNERMVYGNAPFSPVSDGTNIPTNYTIDNAQLPLFAHDHSRICNRADWWLRGVVSAAYFACVNYNGNCSCNSASNTWPGVRPVFAIC